MPVSLWLKLKTDQFLDSTTFVTQTKYPKPLLYYLHKKKQKKPPELSVPGLFLSSLYCTFLWLFKLKTFLSGDIETIPGPAQKESQKKSFSIYHWNLNSITAHGYTKVSLLKACNYSPQNGYYLFIGKTFWL